MRILILGTFPSSTVGTRAVSEDLGERLAASGWSVTTRSRARARTARLLDIVATAWRRRGDYAVGLVDVFSGRAFFLAEAACWTLRRAKRPYILALHGGALPAFARRWPRRVRRLVESAAAVAAPSRYLAAELGPFKAPIHIVPNPISLARYPFRVRTTPKPCLIWLRSFHRIYDPVLACHVLARLRRDYPEARLIMIGPDKRDGSLERVQSAIEALGLGDRVELPGPIAKRDVPRWLSGSDVFLNTTSIDNAPVSVLEAQACGLCVVSTQAGGLPYVLADEQDALLVPDRDPDALAAAVRRILTEPGLGERLSRGGRMKAAGHDWEVVLPEWRRLFQSAGSREAP
jgi:glycosyltransferase involved in cell wall biosynthesis